MESIQPLWHNLPRPTGWSFCDHLQSHYEGQTFAPGQRGIHNTVPKQSKFTNMGLKCFQRSVVTLFNSCLNDLNPLLFTCCYNKSMGCDLLPLILLWTTWSLRTRMLGCSSTIIPSKLIEHQRTVSAHPCVIGSLASTSADHNQ